MRNVNWVGGPTLRPAPDYMVIGMGGAIVFYFWLWLFTFSISHILFATHFRIAPGGYKFRGGGSPLWPAPFA